MRLLRTFLAVSVLAALAWLAYRSLDWENLAQGFVGADTGFLFWMMAAWSMLLVLRPLRLMIILKAMIPDMQFKYGAIAKANILAVASNNLLPARAGDLLMVLILRNSSIKARHTLPATVMDKGIDLATALVLFLVVLATVPATPAWVTNSAHTALVAFFLALAGGCAIAYRPGAFLPCARRLLSGFSEERRMRWLGLVNDMTTGFAAAAKPLVLIKALALTALIWSFTVVSYLAGIRSVGSEGSLAAAAFTAGAVSLSFLVPITPGGLGVFHAAAVVALSLFAVPLEQGMAFAILAHGLPFLTSIVLGYGISLTSGFGIGLLTQTRKNDDD